MVRESLVLEVPAVTAAPVPGIVSGAVPFSTHAIIAEKR